MRAPAPAAFKGKIREKLSSILFFEFRNVQEQHEDHCQHKQHTADDISAIHRSAGQTHAEGNDRERSHASSRENNSQRSLRFQKIRAVKQRSAQRYRPVGIAADAPVEHKDRDEHQNQIMTGKAGRHIDKGCRAKDNAEQYNRLLGAEFLVHPAPDDGAETGQRRKTALISTAWACVKPNS